MNNWKLLTKSRGGTVSLIKGLTKGEAEFMRCRLLGIPATGGERALLDEAQEAQIAHAKARRASGTGMVVNWERATTRLIHHHDGDIVLAEIFE